LRAKGAHGTQKIPAAREWIVRFLGQQGDFILKTKRRTTAHGAALLCGVFRRFGFLRP